MNGRLQGVLRYTAYADINIEVVNGIELLIYILYVCIYIPTTDTDLYLTRDQLYMTLVSVLKFRSTTNWSMSQWSTSVLSLVHW